MAWGKSEAEAAPTPTVLGTMSADAVKGLMDEDAGPPPWQTSGAHPESDARNFVDVPPDWVLRWLNPRLIDLLGWRDWKPVMASDPRVVVHVKTCVDPSNNIRRGGHSGDVLSYMPRHWYEAKRAAQTKTTQQATQSAVDRQAQLREDFSRGRYGPSVRLDSATHPTHTIADGRTMVDP